MKLSATGETAPRFTVKGELPRGLRLSTSGLLTGRPTAYGRWTFSITATNTAGTATSDPLKVVVGGAPKRITGPKVLRWVEGDRDRVRLRTKTLPMARYRVVRGNLPDGLKLSKRGVLKGRTNEGGRHTAVVRMRNTFGTGRDRLVIRVTEPAPQRRSERRPLPPV